MKGRQAALLIAVIPVAATIAYVLLHDRSPQEAPPGAPASSLVAHDGAASRA
ncbi:MAG TPA: hypothetical protein VGD42_15045 [Lysobacter sp.]